VPRTDRHIVLLTPGFPENEGDSRCIPALQDYVAAFARANPHTRVTVIALHYPPRAARHRWHGVDVVACGAGHSVTKPLRWIDVLREIRAAHRAAPVGVVHSFWLGECALIGAAAAAWIGIPHICTLMGQELNSRNLYAGCIPAGRTLFIAPSEGLAEDLRQKAGIRAAAVIPWGVDLPAAPAAPRDIALLGAGSLLEAKNFGAFLNVAAALAPRRPDLRCVLAGEGPEARTLAAMTRTLGLERHVTLAGVLPRGEVLSLMRRSRVLLHPSRYEGFGHVFAEALASGMRIVSLNVGCARTHPRWHIAADETELVSCAEAALDAPAASDDADNPFPVADTVRRYASLYGIDDGGGR
jgi:glycosyltransferase involved in cell wall biosynthesis